VTPLDLIPWALACWDVALGIQILGTWKRYGLTHVFYSFLGLSLLSRAGLGWVFWELAMPLNAALAAGPGLVTLTLIGLKLRDRLRARGWL
jgi:hypothetical protein